MFTFITNSVYCLFKGTSHFVQHSHSDFRRSVCVCLCEDGFSDAITLNDLPNHVVLTMTESSTQITDMTLLENNSSNNLTKLSNMLTV